MPTAESPVDRFIHPCAERRLLLVNANSDHKKRQQLTQCYKPHSQRWTLNDHIAIGHQ